MKFDFTAIEARIILEQHRCQMPHVAAVWNTLCEPPLEGEMNLSLEDVKTLEPAAVEGRTIEELNKTANRSDVFVNTQDASRILVCLGNERWCLTGGYHYGAMAAIRVPTKCLDSWAPLHSNAPASVKALLDYNATLIAEIKGAKARVAELEGQFSTVSQQLRLEESRAATAISDAKYMRMNLDTALQHAKDVEAATQKVIADFEASRDFREAELRALIDNPTFEPNELVGRLEAGKHYLSWDGNRWVPFMADDDYVPHHPTVLDTRPLPSDLERARLDVPQGVLVQGYVAIDDGIGAVLTHDAEADALSILNLSTQKIYGVTLSEATPIMCVNQHPHFLRDLQDVRERLAEEEKANVLTVDPETEVGDVKQAA